MGKILERGSFSNYHITDSLLNEIRKRNERLIEGWGSRKTTVFLSHKHSDLDELRNIIGFLESNYDIEVYIDSMDRNMPPFTEAQTALRIKKIIQNSDRFILLATNDAICSKWCNWELGLGDACKYRDNRIALFPIKDKGEYDEAYKGNEYMRIYPFIEKGDYNPHNIFAQYQQEYYVCNYVNGILNKTSLSRWLNKKSTL